jgi:crossover junction endodeoxyribonuclease RuvC
MRVLGVDPGLAATGYALLEIEQGRARVCCADEIHTEASLSLPARVAAVYETLCEVLAQWRPELVALEGLYSDYKFPRTAILMGHVRGAICLASEQRGARLEELSATEVKRALTGSGRASKAQVMRAVAHHLTLGGPPTSEHIADALALAFVCASRSARRALPAPRPARPEQERGR